MRAPKKNIHKSLSDVKSISPASSEDSASPLNSRRLLVKAVNTNSSSHPASSGSFFKSYSSPSRQKRPSLGLKVLTNKKKFIFRILLASFIIFFTSYAFFFSGFKNNVLSSSQLIIDKVSESALHFSSLDFRAGEESLSSVNSEIKEISHQAKNLGLARVATFLGNFFPKIERTSQSLFSLEKVTDSAVQVSGKLDNLKENGFTYFMEGQGTELLSLLKNIETDLKVISQESSGLANAASVFKADSDSIGKIILFQSSLEGFNDFLDSLIAFLSHPLERHWLVLFQNPSEMRPSGGFIGSFADFSVKDGALSQLEISDIYDPDGWVEEKIVPPQPLQVITTDWEARDANWFFDFQDSAQQVIYFLNSSKIYVERGVKFEGAIAINTEVLKSFLEIIGPLELPEYELTLTPENFLEEIQYEIEVKRSKDQGQPKTILKDATPLIIERLSNLNLQQKEAIIEQITYHLENKDIMFYSQDKTFQNLFEKYNVAGRVYQPSFNSPGEYLAVVNANIAGGKTDAFITQEIYFKSEIGLDGQINNYLTIERTHNGRGQEYSWYTIKNQDFIRILTPKNSELIKLSGNTTKKIYPPINYEQEGYIINEKVDQLQSDNFESNKTVFSAWLTTLVGQTKTLRLDYKNPNNLLLFNGAQHTFVFDKQSGVQGGLNFEIESPPGYKWAESDKFTFSYQNPNPPKRVIITLTLEKI